MKPNILVSITGYEPQHWQDKLKEIEAHDIKEVALFLEMFEKAECEKIYTALLASDIKRIPLAHIRHDMIAAELQFLQDNLKTNFFT